MGGARDDLGQLEVDVGVGQSAAQGQHRAGGHGRLPLVRQVTGAAQRPQRDRQYQHDVQDGEELDEAGRDRGDELGGHEPLEGCGGAEGEERAAEEGRVPHHLGERQGPCRNRSQSCEEMATVVQRHTDFRFQRRLTQVGCYWGGGGHTELYLIEGERLALVDTGVADTPQEYVEPALRAIGRSLADVDVVINTHGHHDHAGGNHQVWRASGCEVWIHEADAAITQDADHAFELFFARNQRLLGGTPEQVEAARREHAAAAGPPAPISRTFGDGEKLDLGAGVRLRVVHTPGHTQGCCTLFWEREGIAISGDSVLGRGSRPGGMPLIFYPEQYRRTIERVRALDARVLCLGHHYRSLRQTNESLRFDDLIGAFLNESREIQELIERGVAEALDAVGRDAPFERVARESLRRIGGGMPLENEPGGDWPNGAVAAISAAWGAMTGQSA